MRFDSRIPSAGNKHACCALPVLLRNAVHVARRRYCTNEPEWASANALLDEFGGAGWQLIGDLVSGSQPTGELLANPFLHF